MYIVLEREDVLQAMDSIAIELFRQLAFAKHTENTPDLASLLVLER